MTLPDGSKVWLNAASSLTYTTPFKGMPQRSVELTGEAYFEVAKDKAHPFIVKHGSQQVEVLGTHFNVSTYDREPLITTLEEGSVKVSSGTISKLIVLGNRRSLAAVTSKYNRPIWNRHWPERRKLHLFRRWHQRYHGPAGEMV